MDKDELKRLEKDTTGLETYDFLVNHLDELTDGELTEIVNHLAEVDHSGLYLASGVKYLNGVDKARFSEHINRMTALTIDRDRERRYISDLIISLYGADYYDRIAEFESDDNFRRIYKRMHPTGAI